MAAMVSIVIPVYNEADCLETNVAAIEQYLENESINYELILVNDGSFDSTESICRDIANRNRCVRLISYNVNQGKGYAVKAGVLGAKGVYRVFLDADLAVPVQFIGTCVKQLKNGAKMVIGSRHLPGSCIKVHQETIRQFMGAAYRFLVKFFIGLKVSDVTCGLKGFSGQAATDIFLRAKINRWGYDAELIFLAQKLGYRIDEIPVDWYHSYNSKVMMGLDSLRSLIEMLQIYYYYYRGRYRIS